jgi:hypothetical protein
MASVMSVTLMAAACGGDDDGDSDDGAEDGDSDDGNDGDGGDGDDGDDDDGDDNGNDDADPTTNPSGPSTDPDDGGSSEEGPGTDPDATGPADTSGTGDPIDPIDPLALDDDFDDGLDGWSTMNESSASIAVEGGALHLEPNEWTVWVDAMSSAFVHKPVAGDFKVTAAVTARGVQNPDAPPPPLYRFGGIMARDPGGDAENHVFIVLGTDEDPSVETKNTVNSVSSYEGPPWPSGSGEIRICRIGDVFTMYVRSEGGTWEEQASFDRPDLPDEVQVGPIAYNYDEGANLRASFDFVDFEPVSGSGDCTE